MARPRNRGAQLGFRPSCQLYLGDNLDILRLYVQPDSVDLVYLDPPFNSQRDYNVLFAHKDGGQPAAQAKAFGDTWRWDAGSAAVFRSVVLRQGPVSRALRAFHELLGGAGAGSGSDMLAYLTMMAPRLVELQRVLKSTGTIYLHCDPTASHYLKVLMDAVFGASNFRSEIVWKRTGTHSSANRWGPVHDVILMYGNGGEATWNRPYAPHDDTHRSRHYRNIGADGRRYTHGELTAPGVRHGRSGEVWRGFDVTSLGRHWMTTVEKLDALDANGRIYFPEGGGWPRLIRYEDESPGRAMGDVWTDIPPINMKARERLGYPTQKPIALLERLLTASTNPGDVILDPFCGCGTAVDAAQKMGRRWIGIDITKIAIDTIEKRLRQQHGELDYSVDIQPTTIEEARELARRDKWKFQQWVGARLGIEDMRRGRDGGVDGEIVDMHPDGTTWKALLSVKGGGTKPGDLRDLYGTVVANSADTGIFVCLGNPTKDMVKTAADAGFSEDGIPRLQIITVPELFEGKIPTLPDANPRDGWGEVASPRPAVRRPSRPRVVEEPYQSHPAQQRRPA